MNMNGTFSYTSPVSGGPSGIDPCTFNNNPFLSLKFWKYYSNGAYDPSVNGSASAFGQSATISSAQADYMPDEKTALRIGEAAPVERFGLENVNKHLPLLAKRTSNDAWLVSVTPHTFLGYIFGRKVGAGYAVWIDAHSGRVKVMEHMKYFAFGFSGSLCILKPRSCRQTESRAVNGIGGQL